MTFWFEEDYGYILILKTSFRLEPERTVPLKEFPQSEQAKMVSASGFLSFGPVFFTIVSENIYFFVVNFCAFLRYFSSVPLDVFFYVTIVG